MYICDELVPILHDQRFDNANDAYKWLQEKFGTVSEVKLQTLTEKVMEKFTDSFEKFSARDYITEKTEFRRVFNENVPDGDKIPERILINAILYGLPKEFDSMRTSIGIMGERLDLKALTDKILSEEARIKLRVTEVTKENTALAAFVPRGRGRGPRGYHQPGRFGGNGFPSHPGRGVHKHSFHGGRHGRGRGHSHWRGGRGRGRDGRGRHGRGGAPFFEHDNGGAGYHSNIICYACNQPGHIARDCPTNKNAGTGMLAACI